MFLHVSKGSEKHGCGKKVGETTCLQNDVCRAEGFNAVKILGYVPIKRCTIACPGPSKGNRVSGERRFAKHVLGILKSMCSHLDRNTLHSRGRLSIRQSRHAVNNILSDASICMRSVRMRESERPPIFRQSASSATLKFESAIAGFFIE